MDGGRLVESGSRDELLTADGIYASMIRTKRETEAAGFVPAAAAT